MIKSWPTLECYLPARNDIAALLRHVGSRARDAEAGALPQGDTVWLGEFDGRPAGVAWEWAEFRPGVVMMADPNSVVTNLRFVDDEHCAAAPLSVLVALNRIVHGLPWQRAVCEMLRAHRSLPHLSTGVDAAGAVGAVADMAARAPSASARAGATARPAGARTEPAVAIARRQGAHLGQRRGDRSFADEDRRAA